ncbi:MAG: hypothetical protein E6R04_04110 [Spirochaetes bacterium]|nr:MAG: hypothetical protein E6R04_04110 [Spirochaetota bacterium]
MTLVDSAVLDPLDEAVIDQFIKNANSEGRSTRIRGISYLLNHDNILQRVGAVMDVAIAAISEDGVTFVIVPFDVTHHAIDAIRTQASKRLLEIDANNAEMDMVVAAANIEEARRWLNVMLRGFDFRRSLRHVNRNLVKIEWITRNIVDSLITYDAKVAERKFASASEAILTISKGQVNVDISSSNRLDQMFEGVVLLKSIAELEG